MKCLLALQEAGAADSSSEEQEQETSMQRAKEEEDAMVQLPAESRVILFEDSESKVWYLLRPFDNMMVKLKIHDPVALVIQQNDQFCSLTAAIPIRKAHMRISCWLAGRPWQLQMKRLKYARSAFASTIYIGIWLFNFGNSLCRCRVATNKPHKSACSSHG